MKLVAYAAVLALAAATAACSAGPGYVSTGTYGYTPGYSSYGPNPAINSPVQGRTYSAQED